MPSDTLRATLTGSLLLLPRTGTAEVVGAPLGGEGPQDRARWQSSNLTLALVSRVQSNLSYALVESERVVSTPLVVKRSDSNHTLATSSHRAFRTHLSLLFTKRMRASLLDSNPV